jgi:hypothetical protein
MKLSASTMKPTDLTLREIARAYFRLNENEATSARQQELWARIIAQVKAGRKGK